MSGRHQSKQVVAITRCAQSGRTAALEYSAISDAGRRLSRSMPGSGSLHRPLANRAFAVVREALANIDLITMN
jgi:hypothetical protein